MYKKITLITLSISFITLYSDNLTPESINSSHKNLKNLPSKLNNNTPDQDPFEQMTEIELLRMIAQIQLMQAQIQENALNEVKKEKQLMLQRAQEQERQRIKQEQEEAEKGFSFTECGIVLRDTFLEQFSLRKFSLEFCSLLVTNLRSIVMKKALKETLGVPDIILGDIPAQYGYRKAAVYPMTFLEAPSLSNYAILREHKCNLNDPKIAEIKAETNKLLTAHTTTRELLDAYTDLHNVKNKIEETDPAVQKIEEETDATLRLYHTTKAQLHAEEEQLALTKKLNSRQRFYQEAKVSTKPSTSAAEVVDETTTGNLTTLYHNALHSEFAQRRTQN